MNDSFTFGPPPPPPPIIGETAPPPLGNQFPTTSPTVPLGEGPGDTIPIPNLVAAIEGVLRHPRRILFQLTQERPGRLILALLTTAILSSLIYGFVVGTFSSGEQLWTAPIKISIGLLLSALICLPSLYIFTCLSGS